MYLSRCIKQSLDIFKKSSYESSIASFTIIMVLINLKELYKLTQKLKSSLIMDHGWYYL